MLALRVHDIDRAAGKQLLGLIVQHLHIGHQNQRGLVWYLGRAVHGAVVSLGKAPCLVQQLIARRHLGLGDGVLPRIQTVDLNRAFLIGRAGEDRFPVLVRELQLRAGQLIGLIQCVHHGQDDRRVFHGRGRFIFVIVEIDVGLGHAVRRCDGDGLALQHQRR